MVPDRPDAEDAPGVAGPLPDLEPATELDVGDEPDEDFELEDELEPWPERKPLPPVPEAPAEPADHGADQGQDSRAQAASDLKAAVVSAELAGAARGAIGEVRVLAAARGVAGVAGAGIVVVNDQRRSRGALS